MDDELLGRLADLRDAAANLSGQLTWAAASAQTGADTFNSVTITLTADSAVEHFALEAGWRQRLTPDSLNTAIVQAFTNAVKATIEAFAERANHLAETGQTPKVDMPPVAASPLPAPTREEAAAFAQKLYQSISAADDHMQEFRDLVAGQIGKQSRVASSTGMVHLIVSNGVLTGVDINDRWLRGASDRVVEKELTDVLRSTFPGVSQRARQSAMALPAISAVLAAASRPAELLRQLGLPS